MRKALIAAGALALALTVGACGDEKDPGTATGGTGTGQTGGQGGVFNDAQSLVDAAKEGTSAAKSAKFTMEGNVAGQALKGSGAGVFAGSESKMQMTMEVMGQSIEMRQIGTTIYMKMPTGMPGADASKPWIKMDTSGMPGVSEQMDKSDPTKILEYMVEAGAVIKSTEQGQVDGQPATIYKLEVDTAKMMEKMGGGAAGQAPPAGMEKLPVELAINGENLPVQVAIDMGASMGKLTMKYSDWGSPVTVEEPPADQVGEMPGGMPGASGAPVPSTPN